VPNVEPLPDSRAYFGLFLLIAGVTAYRALVLATADIGLYVDEAYYWGWAQQLDWGYYSKPPMIAALIAFTTTLCGDGVFCVKAGALLVYPITTWLVFRLGQVLFDARVGLWAAALFLLMPGVALSNLIISTDVLLLLFWAWGMVALVRALETNAWRHWLMLGLACGLGLLSKYTMALFAPSVLLVLLLVPAWRTQLLNPRLWLAALLALLILTPNIVWNAQHGWPTFQHTAEISNLGHAGLYWDELGEFLSGQLAVFGPISLILWLVALFKLPASKQKNLLAAFSLVFLLAISAQALLGRANANWAAPAFVAASVLLAAWGVQQGVQHRRWLIAAIILNTVIMLGAYHYTQGAQWFGVEMTGKTDPFKRLRGWDQLAEQYTARQTLAPQALLMSGDRDLLAQLGYHLHLHPGQIVSWNAGQGIRHQYDLMHPLGQSHISQDMLMVTNEPLPEALTKRFNAVETLEPLHVQIHKDWALQYKLYWLKGFRG
jgi:4-amino-4-deoxy-L-arabinose transferase-like glycosyltransferase